MWLSFSQTDLGPRSAQELFWGGFWKSLKLFPRRFVLTASGTEIVWRVSLKVEAFLATSRFHCHRFEIEDVVEPHLTDESSGANAESS